MNRNIIKASLAIAFLPALLLASGLLAACSDNTPEPTLAPNVLTISPASLPEAIAGQPYTATITVTGNRTPVGYIGVESGALPTGLEIRYKQIENTALIEGTPQKAGSFKFTVNTWCMGTNSPGQTRRINYELVVK